MAADDQVRVHVRVGAASDNAFAGPGIVQRAIERTKVRVHALPDGAIRVWNDALGFTDPAPATIGVEIAPPGRDSYSLNAVAQRGPVVVRRLTLTGGKIVVSAPVLPGLVTSGRVELDDVRLAGDLEVTGDSSFQVSVIAKVRAQAPSRLTIRASGDVTVHASGSPIDVRAITSKGTITTTP